MIIPVRCFTCGRVIADCWAAFNRLTREEEERDGKEDAEKKQSKSAQGRALDRLGMHTICCRTMLLTHVDMSQNI